MCLAYKFEFPLLLNTSILVRKTGVTEGTMVSQYEKQIIILI
jgi:hypothetical protein